MGLATPTSRTNIRARLAPFDCLWAIVAPFVALALRDLTLLDPGDFLNDVPQTYRFAFVAASCTLASSVFFRLGDGMSRFFSIRDALLVCAASATAVASSSVILFTISRLDGVPRSTPLIHGLVLASGLLLWRAATGLFYREKADLETSPVLASATDRRRVILIGVDRFAAAAIRLIDYQRPRTTQIVAALDVRPSNVGRQIYGARIVGLVQDLDAVIEEYVIHGVDIDEVWLSDEAHLPRPVVDRIADQCRMRGVPILLISEAFNLSPKGRRALDEEGRQAAPEATVRNVSDYFRRKRAFDVVATLCLIVTLLPVAICVACITLFDVGAPVVFWQQRTGRNGKKFLLYKFRTYHAPFDKHGRRILDEERLSKLGRAIRASHLDELPQLYNVLIGDMSLVGPRPLLPVDQPQDPRTRLLVRPGLTGWAQINGGAQITPEEKEAMDAWYVRHASLALDLRILLRTALHAATGEKVDLAAIEESRRWRRREGFEFSSIGGAAPRLRIDAARRRGLG